MQPAVIHDSAILPSNRQKAAVLMCIHLCNVVRSSAIEVNSTSKLAYSLVHPIWAGQTVQGSSC